MRLIRRNTLVYYHTKSPVSYTHLDVYKRQAQGRSAIRSFDRLFDLSRILVHTRTREKFEAFRPQAQDGLRARLDYAPTPKALAEQSEILITATTSHTPVIRAEWVPQGAFVGGVYSFYDLDSTLSAQADKWVLGHRRSDGDEILDNPDFAGKLSAGDVYGTLGEIVCGKLPGRESPDERIVFTHMGMGALDIAIGNRIVEKAVSYTHLFERSEFKAYPGGFAAYTKPVIPPLYESRSDTDILRDLAELMELDDPLLREGYEAAIRYMIRDTGVTVEELQASDCLLYTSRCV